MILIGLSAGPSDLDQRAIIDALLKSNREELAYTIIWNIRLPRVAVSFLTGASLGLAGVLIQLSSRSTFGDPNLFGIGGGGSIFLAAITAGIVTVGQFAGFAGCVASSLVVALLLAKLIASKDLSPVKLTIMGIAVGALTVSVSTSVISHGEVFPTQVMGLIGGSFSGSNWETFRYLLPTVVICFGISAIMTRKFYPIMLGDTLSRSLGVDPIRTRYLAMGTVGILTGASVYSGGLIGFVGLVSPHITRRILSNNPLHLLIGSSMVGAVITLGSDQLSRLLFAPAELPVGMVTTILGAPMMIYLALKIK